VNVGKILTNNQMERGSGLSDKCAKKKVLRKKQQVAKSKKKVVQKNRDKESVMNGMNSKRAAGF